MVLKYHLLQKTLNSKKTFYWSNKQLDFHKTVFQLNYKSDLNSGSFSEILSESLSKDRFLQYTSKGIHRDDLNFIIENNKIKNFGSQGQQKSFLIALKLAQFDYYKTLCNLR